MAAGSSAGGRRGYQRELAAVIPLVEELVRDLQERLRRNEDDEIEGRARDYLMQFYSNIQKLLDKGSDSLPVTITREYLGSFLLRELDRSDTVLKTRNELTGLRGILTALRSEQQQRGDRVPRRQPEDRTIGGVPHATPWKEGGPSGPARRQYRSSLKAPVSSPMR